MIQVKRNLTKARGAIGYEFNDSAGFIWTGESQLTPEDFTASGSGGEGTSLREATEFLRRVLERGPRRVDDVRKEAEANAISLMTLRRAQRALSIRPTAVYYSGKRKGISHWTWELPPALNLFDDQDGMNI